MEEPSLSDHLGSNFPVTAPLRIELLILTRLLFHPPRSNSNRPSIPRSNTISSNNCTRTASPRKRKIMTLTLDERGPPLFQSPVSAVFYRLQQSFRMNKLSGQYTLSDPSLYLNSHCNFSNSSHGIVHGENMSPESHGCEHSTTILHLPASLVCI